MSIDASALRVANKVMKERPLHCTRTEEVDERGGHLVTTSMMWYRPPRSKDSSWVQVTSTNFDYYRPPSGRKRMESWNVTTLHIEYAESAEVPPTVVVHTCRHNFPSMVFDNYESRIIDKARSAHWSRKSSKLTGEIKKLSSYAEKRRNHNYTRALMSAHEQFKLLKEKSEK